MHSALIKISGENKESVEHWAQKLTDMFGNSFVFIEEELVIEVVKDNETSGAN